MGNCNLCPQSLPGQVPGYGNPRPKIIVIGEEPNMDDENTGRPFSAGRNPNKDYPNLIIPRVLRAIGIDPADAYFAYALRCNTWHRAKRIKPTAAHLGICRSQHLELDLAKVDCPVVVACGDLALRSLLPESEGGVGKNRGRWHDLVLGGQKRLMRVTYAPNFIQSMSMFYAAELGNGKIVTTERFNPPGSCGDLFQRDIKAVRAKLRELGLLDTVAASPSPIEESA